MFENDNLKTNVKDQTTQNEVVNKQVVDLTGENQKLFQDKQEESFKRKENEEELEFVITKKKEQNGRLFFFIYGFSFLEHTIPWLGTRI